MSALYLLPFKVPFIPVKAVSAALACLSTAANCCNAKSVFHQAAKIVTLSLFFHRAAKQAKTASLLQGLTKEPPHAAAPLRNVPGARPGAHTDQQGRTKMTFKRLRRVKLRIEFSISG